MAAEPVARDEPGPWEVLRASGARLRALQEVTAGLSGALRATDVLSVILREGRSGTGASGSGVALPEGDAVRYHQLDGYSSDVRATWSSFGLDSGSPVTHVLRTGQPLFLGSPEAILARFDVEVIRTFLEASGEQAMARLPLRTSAGVVGVLSFGYLQRRDFPQDERAFLMALAGQCAQALERAWLYERELTTARTLQRSLLPGVLPDAAGVRLAARCLPATAGTEVGGDWYDALHLPDGRLGVVVGDVMGKGIRAASVMGQVRNALRGLVHADPAPATLLTRLDGLVTAMDDDEELVTLAYGVLDPVCGRFTWSCAGHPPPLLLTADGDALYVEAGDGLPLGLGGARGEGALHLAPGDAVLLYSDGLVETRRRPLVDGLPMLQRRVAALARPDVAQHLEAAADALVEGMTADGQDDDVTLLVLGREPVGERTAEVLLPARPSSAGLARRFVAERLAAWDAADLADVALLCVSEVVTNAVLHACSAARLRLRCERDVLHVEVHDGGGPLPLSRRLPAEDDVHGRGLVLLDALARRWGAREVDGGKTVWFELVRDPVE